MSSSDEITSRLLCALDSELPALERVTGLTRLSGGANQETWSFDAITHDGTTPLILRRSALANEESSAGKAPFRLDAEARILQAVLTHGGVPVPRVRHVLRVADALGAGFIMDRIEGETLAPKILRDAAFAEIRPQLAGQCGAILARIHSVPIAEVDHLQVSTAADQLKYYRDLYDSYDYPHPVFELAFRWLADHMIADTIPALVHGDFRNGNLIIGSDGVRAVLDWELAHLGDPMEDLGWICVNSWRFGNRDKPVGGFGEREALYRAYENANGKMDRDRARFWEVMGTLKWGVMCMTMHDLFKSGQDRSLERASIGRRCSETEIDLLDMIGRTKEER